MKNASQRAKKVCPCPLPAYCSAQVILYTEYPRRGIINVTQCSPPTQTTVFNPYDLKISNPFQTIFNSNDFQIDTSIVICSPPTKSDFFETWESYMQFKSKKQEKTRLRNMLSRQETHFQALVIRFHSRKWGSHFASLHQIPYIVGGSKSASLQGNI